MEITIHLKSEPVVSQKGKTMILGSNVAFTMKDGTTGRIQKLYRDFTDEELVSHKDEIIAKRNGTWDAPSKPVKAKGKKLTLDERLALLG